MGMARGITSERARTSGFAHAISTETAASPACAYWKRYETWQRRLPAHGT